MAHHSKFPLFAVLALLCVTAENCSAPGVKLLTCDPQQTEEIERQSVVTSAIINFNDGGFVKAYRVGVRKDTTEWYEKDSLGNIVSDVRHVAPTSDISSISISEPQELQGLLIGAGIGAVLGALIYEGAKHPGSPSDDDNLFADFVNWIALNAGFEGSTIGMGTLLGVGGLASGAGIRQWYDTGYAKDSTSEPIHWFNAQTDTVTVDTATKVDTAKLH